MTSYALSIDPGMSSGVCLFSWDGPHLGGAFKQEKVWQFSGGSPNLALFLETAELEDQRGELWFGGGKSVFPLVHIERLVVEKFTPRGGAGFSLTQASAEPLRGEGVLIGRGMLPWIDWQEPSYQYFMGGEGLSEKKKQSREFLKLNGLYMTGSTVGQKDADDAISAELHAIAWLRRKRHMPTLVELFQKEDEV